MGKGDDRLRDLAAKGKAKPSRNGRVNGHLPGIDTGTGDPDQADALQAILDALGKDADLAVREALLRAESLARLKEAEPAKLELLYTDLRGAGAKARGVTEVQRAVNAIARKQKQEAERRRRDEKIERQRQEAGRLAETGFSNFADVAGEDGSGRTMRQGLPVQTIADRLGQLTCGWPRRIDNLLFAENPGPHPLWLENANALFAWVSRHLSAQGPNLLDWDHGGNLVSEARLYAYLTQNTEAYDALECYPHHPPLPRHYYMHAPIEPGDGKHLRRLLKFFRPATDIDGDLIKAFFLTLLWGGSPGQRPAWLFTAEDGDRQGGRGVGKSTIGQIAGQLLGGYITLSTSDSYRDLIARILSPKAMLQRVVLLDNLKTLKLNWAELEAMITADSISGYRLYHGEGRRVNTLTVVLTVNGASVSKDMAQRCVIIQVKRPRYSATWRADVEKYINDHRWEIIGDIVGQLQAPAHSPAAFGRWGRWEAEVLARACPELADAQKVIRERQESVDDDEAERDLVRDHLLEMLRALKHGDPDRVVFFIPSGLAAAWCNEATGDRRPKNKACSHLSNLNIQELKAGLFGPQRKRGFWWRGAQSDPNGKPIEANIPAPKEGGSAPWSP